MQKVLSCGAVLALLVALGTTCYLLAAETPATNARSVSMDQIRPKWAVGDSWVIETTSVPIQARADLKLLARSEPVQWQFTVQKYEKVLSDNCYKIVVRCLLPGPPQPTTVLWVDRDTQTLRQVQTQIPVGGKFRTMTENYRFAGGAKSPVLGPLSALPIDLPFFQGTKTKGLESFRFEANDGPAGKKALGEVGFLYEVSQSVSPASSGQVKNLVPERYAKDLDASPTVEVDLKTAGRQVRQLWQPGKPWPVYADNGTTIARLVKVIPGN